jgi:hypothetical protein
MRLLAALAIALVALLVLTIRQATSKRANGGAATAPLAEIDDALPPPPRRGAPSPSPPYLPPFAGGTTTREGVAHLHGRVLWPAASDEQISSGDWVGADDGERILRAQTDDDGRFSLHLPPGRYELIAAASRWSGSVADVSVAAGDDREIDIRLSEGARLSGVLRAQSLEGVRVAPLFAGRREGIGEVDLAADGHFDVSGLLPGRRYDLEIEGDDIRKTVLRGLAAPATNLDIALTPLPVLRGAFGFPRDGECPIETIEVTTADDDDEQSVGPDCRFEMLLRVGTSTDKATVVASGGGWHVERTVDIPARGDPDPVCLNPPCRANPLDGAARLRVTMERSERGRLTIHAVADRAGERSVSCADETCVVEPLAPNHRYHVTALADGCQSHVQDVTVVAGDNTLRLPCRRERRIQGVLRGTGQPPVVAVRCPGGDRTVRQSRLFILSCATDATTLEYRVLPDGAWQSAAIPTTEESPLVEISL